MARGKRLSYETKKEILRLSQLGKSGMEIGEELELNAGTVRMFLSREREKGQFFRECEFCEKTIKDVDALFCPYCGKKILTEKDRVMEHLNDIGKCIGEFPNSFRDRIMVNVTAIRKYIREH